MDFGRKMGFVIKGMDQLLEKDWMRWGKEDNSRKKDSIPVLVKGSCVLERGAGAAPSELN